MGGWVFVCFIVCVRVCAFHLDEDLAHGALLPRQRLDPVVLVGWLVGC